MTREKNTNTQAQNAPQFLAWHVTEKDEKSYWNKVGAAWRSHSSRESNSLFNSSGSRESNWEFELFPSRRTKLCLVY